MLTSVHKETTTFENDQSELNIKYKTRYTEHIKALTQPLIKSNFAEHIFNTHHTFTDIETNLEILHTL